MAKTLNNTTFLIMTMFVLQIYAMETSIIPTQVLTKYTEHQLNTYKQLDMSGDDKEKKDLLKTIINKNNLTLTTPLLDDAQKEKLALQNAIYIELNHPTSQENTIIIDRLEQENDTIIVKEYHEKICPKKCIFHGISVCGAITIVACLAGSFTYWITANPCIISSCIG